MLLDLHPLVIHFPIALLSSAVLFDFIAVVFKKDELLITSWWIMLLGLFSSTFSIITGLIDDSLIGHLFTTFPLWENHGLMQIISILIFCSIFIWRTKQPVLFNSKKNSADIYIDRINKCCHFILWVSSWGNTIRTNLKKNSKNLIMNINF